MDPAMLEAVVEAVLASALEDGMSPDLTKLELTFADGGVKIVGTQADGSPYEGEMDAAALADSLDMEAEETAAETPPATAQTPAQGEKAPS